MKYIFSLFLGLSLVASATAQNFQAISFINGQSLSCSNIAQPTNLLSIGVAPTNAVSLQFTNQQGSRLIADGTNNETRNPFVDVPLWADREGRQSILYYQGTNTSLQTWQPSPINLYIKVIGQSGANAGVTFSFFPLADSTNECNAAGSRWDVGVTANTTTPVTLVTNVPLYLWQGCYGMRCTRAVNADTDASSRVDILALELTGFRP